MKKIINIAIIGLGGRGFGLLKNELIRFDDVKIFAVCDIYADRAEKAADFVKSKRGYRPQITGNYRDLLEMKEVDIIMITSSWENHTAIAVESMIRGKFAAMEVGGAFNIDECWSLVNAYEETGTPCMMLENCCYGHRELLSLALARSGFFGDIVHCSGGYLHDRRYEIAFGKENRHYRLKNYLERNCENYPTHELGPISKILKINRGNRMVSLNSFSSKAAGLADYISLAKSEDTELKNASFSQGDIVTTVIKCYGGETIVLTLDTSLPRGYSRGFTVRGTRGAYFEDGDALWTNSNKLASENSSKRVKLSKSFLKKHSHRLNAELKKYKNGTHNGMDALVLRAMVESVKNHSAPPIDVYDAAAWMAVTALSAESIKCNGKTIEFPDFTNGKWKNSTIKSEGIFSLD